MIGKGTTSGVSEAVFRVSATVFERFPLVVIRFVVCLEKGAFVVCFLLLDVGLAWPKALFT